MARFLVLNDKAAKGGDGVTFIRDGFRPLALVMPVIWLLWNRLWLHAALMFATNGMAAWAGYRLWPEAGPAMLMLTNSALGLITAFEGPQWLVADRERKGAVAEGSIIATSIREAEELHAATHHHKPEPPSAPRAGFHPVSQSSLIPLSGA